MSTLLIPPILEGVEYQRITPETAGWASLSFAARRLTQGQTWSHQTGENEMVVVVLGGVCSIDSSQGRWEKIGRRRDVFSGMPYALYLSRSTSFTVIAHSDEVDVAYGWCATNEDHPAQLIAPGQVSVEIRGGGNATRQINSMIPPGFECQRLVVVEVYTPSGNWSSYPPHKHDQHREDSAGNLLEADLEEIYFYKIERPEGFAYQRVYTADGRLNELMMARHDHVVLVPEGYHPVVAAHGYTTYYLNILAGSAQSLANSDDPDYAWVKSTWRAQDPRVPIVSMDMERR